MHGTNSGGSITLKFLARAIGCKLCAAYTDAIAWDDRNTFFARWIINHEVNGKTATTVSLAKLEAKPSVHALCQPLLRK